MDATCILGALLFELAYKMLRRAARKQKDSDLSSSGAFIDTAGDRRKKVEKTKTKVRAELNDEEEAELEALVFGAQPFKPSKTFSDDLEERSSSEEEEESGSGSEAEGDEEGRVSRSTGRRGGVSEQPAWRDEDDDEISVDMMVKMHRKRLRQEDSDKVVSGDTYSKRLRKQFQQLGGDPEWAARQGKRREEQRRRGSDSDGSDSEVEEDGVLQRTGPLLSRSSTRLPPTILDIKRMRDANSAKRAQAAIKSLEFHPTASVILTAGWHKTLDLFQVDGEVNPKLQSIHVQDFPISTAHFTSDGAEVVMAGERKSFYVYDMIAGKITRVYGIRGRRERMYNKFVVSPDNKLLAFLGKDGYILLVSNKTKKWVADLKMNGEVKGVTFTPDSRHLLSIGTDGKVYVWDVAGRSCVHCFTDEGCVVGNRVGVSPNGHYVACGSESGVVNVYEHSECMRTESPKPVKAVMNLTTAVHSLQFNSTSELLAVASPAKKDAVKMVHLPSLTVFSNWPHSHSRLSHPTSLHLSPLSRYMALGNDRGKALLFRLNHYHQGREGQPAMN